MPSVSFDGGTGAIHLLIGGGAPGAAGDKKTFRASGRCIVISSGEIAHSRGNAVVFWRQTGRIHGENTMNYASVAVPVEESFFKNFG